MKKAILLAVLLLLVASVFGCAPKSAAPSDETAEMAAGITGIGEIDALDSDLDMSELDSLDAEFAELDSLFS